MATFWGNDNSNTTQQQHNTTATQNSSDSCDIACCQAIADRKRHCASQRSKHAHAKKILAKNKENMQTLSKLEGEKKQQRSMTKDAL